MKTNITIRNFNFSDRTAVIDLWGLCGLIVPSNNPDKDIDLKMQFQPDLFFLAESDEKIIGSVMIGYDGHRGWLNYLGVHPDYRKSGWGRSLVELAVQKLKEIGCPKLNLQVRNNNTEVIEFYTKLGFIRHEVISMQLKL